MTTNFRKDDQVLCKWAYEKGFHKEVGPRQEKVPDRTSYFLLFYSQILICHSLLKISTVSHCLQYKIHYHIFTIALNDLIKAHFSIFIPNTLQNAP